MKYENKIQEYVDNHKSTVKTKADQNRVILGVPRPNETELKEMHDSAVAEYIKGNGKIGERHEEPEAVKVSNPVANSGISKEIEVAIAAPTFVKPETEPKQEAPKKKRGRPVGSKTKTKTTKKKSARRSSRSTMVNDTALTVGMSQELFDDIQKAATHNFRTLANEVCWVLTQYYNGKL